jgi:chromosomal replication initiation ATPase DnaA
MTEREKTHTCGLIKRAFERAFGCRKNSIEAYDKRTNVAFARHAAMSAAMEIIGGTASAMAARFNRTQHGTVVNAVQANAALMETEQGYRVKVNKAWNLLHAVGIKRQEVGQ